VTLPIAAVTLPIAAVTLPIAAVTLPIAAVTLPIAAVTLPIAAVTLPIAAVNLPIAAVTLPIAAVTLPIADWSDNCCSDPTNDDGPEVSSLYGQCIFSSYTGADMALTMEVQAAAEAASFPARYACTT